METAENGIALNPVAGGNARLLKILAVLLVIACVETFAYWRFAVPADEGAGASAALSPEEARRYMRLATDMLVIDVRSQKEFADGHLPNAVNMPLYAFHHLVKDIPQKTAVLLHCQYGYRSRQAYKLFRRLRPDITHVWYVAGQLHFSLLQPEDAPQ
ncbi:MAG: rhodanese-like domain-containing protein [Desulfovibrio sp.]|uniref:rhodanese-like domain-containing protein n=1 Tax=Desulfovibrio sp. TaxID=885 RepID=UPI00135E4A79|nr:rhodanese-like domain-containing protein [Desulfovibrio sp.]MTJ93234.1 rhodanese-like domain-containing protein [Desulfovibrio sp.]